MPVKIEMLGHELDAEAQLNVSEIDTDKRLLVPLNWRSLGDCEFPVFNGNLLDVPSLHHHLVVDVDLVLDGLETEPGHVGFLVSVVVDDNPHGPQPGHLLSECVGNKHGVHVELLVADEVEGKPVLSLDCVAEGPPRGQRHCKVRVITHTLWDWGAGEVIGAHELVTDLVILTHAIVTVLCSVERERGERDVV